MESKPVPRTVVVVQRDVARGAQWAEALRADGFQVARSDTAEEGVLVAGLVAPAVIIAESTAADLELLLGRRCREARPPLLLVGPMTATLAVRRACAVAVHLTRPSGAQLVAALHELLAGVDDDRAPRPPDTMVPFEVPAQPVTKWRRWFPSRPVPESMSSDDTQPAPWLGVLA
jgi:hypothetical protein